LKLNPNLRLDERNIEVVTEVRSWPESNLRRASVNSFGYGGANAHAILEGADFHIPPGYIARRPRITPDTDRKYILPFSGQGQISLTKRVADLSAFPLDNIRIEDLAYTLSRRSHFPVRGFLLTQGSSLLKDMVVSNLRKLPKGAPEGPKLPFAFIFTGQGAQWPRMGVELIEQFPIYGKIIEDLDNHLSTLPFAPPWRIKGIISQIWR